MYAVETKNLTKRYGKAWALKNLDFTIDANEIMVLLGPNGSGKTTTAAILARSLKEQKKKVLLVPADTQRAA